MRSMISALAIALFAAGAASAQQTSPAEPVVHVGLFNYGQDNRVVGAAYENDQSALRSTVWTSRTGCQIGAGDGKAPAAATDAWEFSGQVISTNADSAVIQLDWRKSIDDGRPFAAAATTQQLTLTKGHPVLLDSITPLAPCSGTAVVFEARYDVDFIRQRIGNLPVRGGSSGGGARSGAVGGSSGVGGGARIGVGTGAGAGSVTGAGVSSGSGSGGGRGGVGAGPKSGSAGTGAKQEALREEVAQRSSQIAQAMQLLNVELWLIHTVGGRDEVMAHPTMRMSREGGASFALNPVTVTTSKGTTGLIQVTGSLRVTKSETGEDQLTFSTSRVLTLAAAGTPRDKPARTFGSSTTSHPMPGPEEVLSFEMPAIQTTDGSTVPDRFSVRVRIAPTQEN